MTTTNRIFELRKYDAVPGKIDALVGRFRDHAAALFEKHGMTNIGFWIEQDDDGKPTETLVYLLAHTDREAAATSWAAFWEDPEWVEVRNSGEQVTAAATSSFLEATDFSPLGAAS
ncbi:MAG TPA: NIPSNAP family protein [Nocardioides sp.]|nr:NIPSNAP family protein [Nocardioides sp.]